MTTQDFIQKTAGTESNRTRTCSSVFTDERGTVYSYGYHYPLAKIIDGTGFVNSRGYSMTTAKHIRWAYQALSHKLGFKNVYSVELTNGNSLTLAGIKESLTRQINDLQEQMDSKKRKNTYVYANLKYDFDQAQGALQKVNDLIKNRGLDV